jgi:glutamine synthetase
VCDAVAPDSGLGPVGEIRLVPDWSTLAVLPYAPGHARVLGDMVLGGRPWALCPREFLRRMATEAGREGLEVQAAFENEFYLLRPTPEGFAPADDTVFAATRAMDLGRPVIDDLVEALLAQGIAVELYYPESGPGQQEISFRYSDVLQAADRQIAFRETVHAVAARHGLKASFLPKVFADKAGNGCHLHFSLWRDGRNAFVGDKALGPVQCSDAFRWFLGGWIAHVPDVMVFYAPTVNSYKRYVDASWAPTRLAWSYDNRTAAFRVVGRGSSLRIECRIPGADCNPYLAFAAALASGLDGIRNRIEPPECFTGDMYAASHLPRVPARLGDAVDRFASSDFATRTFGDDVVEHYAHFFRTEQAAFGRAVTDWERRRYYERI